MASSDAPIQIERVVLTVRDLTRTGDFYQQALGLHRLSGDAGQMVLGAGGRALLELRQDRDARHLPHEAGLFHTAFLLPDRISLAGWLRHGAAQGVALDGASDHLVSEALYLRDPEGNGIEIYADRPRDTWIWSGSEVEMDTRRLDLQDLWHQGSDDWRGMPADAVIGHVHLQVGDLTQAEGFYTDRIGMNRTAHRSGASFFSSGGYHHHLAGNIWNSRGAGPRSKDATGLAEIVLAADPAPLAAIGTSALTDPWGTRITLAPKAA